MSDSAFKTGKGGFGENNESSMSSKSNFFLMNYNIVMLAIHYGSVKILKYLHENFVLKSANPT